MTAAAETGNARSCEVVGCYLHLDPHFRSLSLAEMPIQAQRGIKRLEGGAFAYLRRQRKCHSDIEKGVIDLKSQNRWWSRYLFYHFVGVRHVEVCELRVAFLA